MNIGLAILTRGLACALLAGATGCARFHDAPLSAEKVSAEFEARSLSDPGLEAFVQRHRPSEETSWPPASWDLNNLTLAAFYFHPELDVARAQAAGARAARLTAGQRPNPTLGLSPAYDITTSIPSPWIVAASLDLPLETAGKRGYRAARADRLSDAARFQLAATAWRVRSRVRACLLALATATQREALLKQHEGHSNRCVRLLEGQARAGDVPPIEVTQARAAWNRTRLELHEAELQAATARLQLADALGLPPAALDGVALDLTGFQNLPAEVPDAAARRHALLNRADILAALAEYAAAQSALQLEIARQYPDVHLSPGYEYDQGDNKWGIGLSLELPLLNRNQGRIAEAAAKREELAARFNALQARVLADIEQALAAYRLSVKKAEAAAALGEQLATQVRLAAAMHAAGELAQVDVARRELEAAAAGLAQLDAHAQAQAALGALENALQIPVQLCLAVDQLSLSPRPSPLSGTP